MKGRAYLYSKHSFLHPIKNPYQSMYDCMYSALARQEKVKERGAGNFRQRLALPDVDDTLY